ncbi:MAG: DNA topology modulation protein [Phycisphaeraceae bacterium]|nr:DNA topology modulation protein [Phycisphaeraceae bacterium]
MTPMRRILIVGSGGAGKSTLATQIGQRLGLPVIHLDALFWHAGWKETAKDEWKQTVALQLQQDAWVMDGNYGGTLDQRLATADTVIFLDLPRSLCLFRILKRRVMYRGRTRPDMAAGCPERLDMEFLKWIWNYPRDNRPRLLDTLQAAPPSTQIHVLQSKKDVSIFLDSLTARTT